MYSALEHSALGHSGLEILKYRGNLGMFFMGLAKLSMLQVLPADISLQIT
jgi:hypothetical protein